MRAKLIEIIGRVGRRRLALGTVLVAVRGREEVPATCYERIRPASAWFYLTSLLAILVVVGSESAGVTAAVLTRTPL
jgi:hypothetical protein